MIVEIKEKNKIMYENICVLVRNRTHEIAIMRSTSEAVEEKRMEEEDARKEQEKKQLIAQF